MLGVTSVAVFRWSDSGKAKAKADVAKAEAQPEAAKAAASMDKTKKRKLLPSGEARDRCQGEGRCNEA